MATQSWVQCDACEKWRRVPADYATSLSDDEAWCAIVSCAPIAQPLRRGRSAAATGAAAAAAAACQQRRPRPLRLAPRARRFCANNPDPAHNTCEAPQELSDAEIDRLHAAEHVRPR